MSKPGHRDEIVSNEQVETRAASDAPIVETISSKLIVAANFLRRGATLRYRRLVGLPWVEYGIVAVLGRRKPITVAGLAELLGMDKAQLSRALSNLVRRKLVARSANPGDSREVLVALTKAGLDAHEVMVRAGFYVSFMSGNTTQLGIGLTRFDMSVVRLPAVLLACFVLGAFAGTLLHSLSGRWHLPAILVLEGVLLGLALAFSFFQTPTLGATAPLAIAMGTQNAALRSDRGHQIGGTFVTGTVFGLGEKLALWCLRRGGPLPAFRHALGWLALAAGAAAGPWAVATDGLRALALPAGGRLILPGATARSTLKAGDGTPAEEWSDQLS